MNLRRILQYVFATGILLLTIWSIKVHIQENNDLTVILWMPCGGILLYMASHLLNRTAGIRFYALQAVGVGLVQMLVGLSVLNTDYLYYLLVGTFTMALISLFVYLNMYIAFLVGDRSPGLMFLVAPVSLSILNMIYDGYKYLWIILPISALNLLLFRRKS